MWRYLTAAALLLSSAAIGSCDSCESPAGTGSGIVASLAAACAEGVRFAIQQEVFAVANRSDEAYPELDDWRIGHPGQSPAAPEECPAGWSRHEDSCYLIPPQKTNWYRAHHACAALHPRRSQLASVHPSAGQFVEAMVANYSAEKAVWVGLFGSGRAGNWVWSDGSSFDYAHWDRAQPDGGDPSCVHLGWPGYTNNLWHDNSCGVVVNFLCQINLGKCK